LLTEVAMESADPVNEVAVLTEQVLPRLDELQSYVWRTHLARASNRLMTVDMVGSEVERAAVVFVDIVGFTSRSKELTDAELVEWIEHFEAVCSATAIDLGGRVIKNIGDEVLMVCDLVDVGAELALRLTARGADPDDAFPEVRAGMAYGDMVARLGDVLGPTVNIAARLTSVARPSSVLIDEGAKDALADDQRFEIRKLRRTSVKGYSRLQSWALRRGDVAETDSD
jgi:adenylate cyclase